MLIFQTNGNKSGQQNHENYMNQAIRYSDEDLVNGIRANNHQMLDAVYKEYFPMIAHFIIQNNGSEQDAKDVYQEAIMVFYEKIQDPLFLLTCKIKTYIYSVCRRLWLKRLRHKGKYVGKVDDYEEFLQFEEEVTDFEEQEVQYKTMEDALAQIGEPCSSILKSYYMEENSMQDIAEKLGYTNSNNAKNQKYKCLMRLKKLFFKTYELPS